MRKKRVAEATEKGAAILSSFDKYTTFSYGGTTLTFRTCNGLEKYTEINGIKPLFHNSSDIHSYQEFIKDLNQFFDYDI